MYEAASKWPWPHMWKRIVGLSPASLAFSSSSAFLRSRAAAQSSVGGEVMTPLPNVLHWKIPRGETYIKGEASRGEYGYYLVTDGSGYPRSLKGGDIPMLARIVSACDVWDALTSDQLYRKAWKKADAQNYIDLGSGHHFDPVVVDAFLPYIKHKF